MLRALFDPLHTIQRNESTNNVIRAINMDTEAIWNQ